jgi:hypothetical protein
MSLVRYRTNDYSVPTAYAHQDVVIKGYVDRVDIICRGEKVASHARSYAREDFIADPLHYLALIERKPRSLDQAAPLDGWVWSEDMLRLRRLMEARGGTAGSPSSVDCTIRRTKPGASTPVKVRRRRSRAGEVAGGAMPVAGYQSIPRTAADMAKGSAMPMSTSARSDCGSMVKVRKETTETQAKRNAPTPGVGRSER